jgi:CubicO group peptidase (beta-lactamase class C family)
MSKPITGVAILMLIDQGKISLNDPLSKYIPQFKNMSIAIANTDPGAKYTTVPAYREVTIKDLLTHSSGIGQGKISSAEIAKITPSAFVTLSEYIPKFASVPLEFQPGSLTGYSPKAGFEILGRVVEIVSGETFDKFLSKHLFMPLEMKNTSFAYSPKSLRERIPVMYKTTDKGLIRETSEQSAIQLRKNNVGN